MTKQDFINKLHTSMNGELNKRQVSDMLESVFNTVEEALHSEGECRIAGFGTFTVKDRAPRKGHNPQTGELIDIPARRAVTFSPAKKLKEAFNQ